MKELIIIVILGFVCAFVFGRLLDKSEKVDCIRLQEQSIENTTIFYLLQWEKDMCDAHGIIINAPVKN